MSAQLSGQDSQDSWRFFSPDPSGLAEGTRNSTGNLSLRRISGIVPLGQRPGEDLGIAVPEPLQMPLFGDSPEGALHCYALLDAARIPGLPETLETSRLEHLCLFRDEQRQIGHAAPWLVRLSEDDKFTRNLFRQSQHSWHLWGRDCGIFLRSEAGLAELSAHLRRFTKLRDPRGRVVFFRFWDPLIASHYFSAISHDEARIGRFFRLSSGAGLSLIGQTGPDEVLELVPDPALARTVGPAPVLDDRDLAIFADVAFIAFARQLSGWLVTEYPERLADRPAPDLRRISDHVIAAGRRAGLSMREDFAFLAQMMMTSGGWFLDDAPSAELHRLIAETPAPKAKTMASCFATIHANTPQGELLSQWTDLRAHLAAIPDAESITPARFRDLTARFLSKTGAQVVDAIASTRRRLREIGLADQQLEGRALVLALLLGPRFFEDPFKPWSNLLPEVAIGAAWRKVIFNETMVD